MTNEMLAEFIKQGGNDELIPLLWDKIQKLMFLKSETIYRLKKDSFDKAGIELWDIRQACYPAFLKALEGYKPEQGHKFTSYLTYPFKTAVNELLGIRGKKELLNECISLDKPVVQPDGGECSLSDIIPDYTAQEAFERIEANDDTRILHQAISKLPEREREVIQAHYFDKMTLKLIGEELGISLERVRCIKNSALRKLRMSKELRLMYGELKVHDQWKRMSFLKYNPKYYDIVHELEEKQRKGLLSYGNAQAELYDIQLKYDELDRVNNA